MGINCTMEVRIWVGSRYTVSVVNANESFTLNG